MIPSQDMLQQLFLNALAEDIGSGDITSAVTVPASAEGHMRFVAREPLRACGFVFLPALVEAYHRFTQTQSILKFTPQVDEAAPMHAGAMLGTLEGNARAILAIERTALNLVQYLSGIATLTAQFVGAVEGTHTQILDTRKTLPGWRILSKYAVRCGGGRNHRVGLYDAVLIKDNHIVLAGGLEKAVQAALDDVPEGIPIQVEVDRLDQLEAVLNMGITRILLDNMTPDQLREAVEMNQSRATLEASGGVTLHNVRAIAETGVHFISIGALTHSVKAVDIGLDG